MRDRRPQNIVRSLVLLSCLMLTFAASAQAQPTFSMSFQPSTIGPGSTTTLTYTISNGDLVNPVRNLDFTNTLPAGMTIASPANASTTCFGGAVTAASGGTTISYGGGGGIGINSSCTVSVDVTSSSVGTTTNTSGNLTSDAGNSGGASADLTVANDRPGFTKSFSPNVVGFGGRSTLTFTIDNSANGSLVGNMTFIDNLPSGMEVASPSNEANDCSGTLTAVGNTVNLVSGLVNANSTCTISVDIVANNVGELGNTTNDLSYFFPTSGSAGKASAVLTATSERISLTKSFTNDPVAPGGTVDLQYTIRNLERSSSALNISFSDDLDSVLTGLAAVSLPSNPCGTGSAISGTGLLTLTGGNLSSESSCTFVVTLQVPGTSASGNFASTTGDVSAEIGGRKVTGTGATDTLSVNPGPALTKTFLPDVVAAGNSVTMQFSITNTSTTNQATDITFTDEIESGLGTPSLPAAGFCGAGSLAFVNTSSGLNVITIQGASLAAADTCTFDVVFNIADGVQAAVIENTTSEITATVEGETATGAAASDTLTIVGAPVLNKQYIDDPVAPGGTATLRFTLSHNEGATANATDITFTDDLGLFTATTPVGAVCGAGSSITGTNLLTFDGGTLAPGESCTFDVTVDVPVTTAAGIYNNVTSNVTATVGGSSATGNSASDNLTVGFMTFTKAFSDESVLPGQTTTLTFTITNSNSATDATGIFFTDTLSNMISGTVASGLPLSTPQCGAGSSISGTNFLIFVGGALLAGESCTFDVPVVIPSFAANGTYSNITSNLVANLDGVNVNFDPASDGLTVDNVRLGLAKEFIDDPAAPGGLVTLRFTLDNLDAVNPISDIAFSDNLTATLEGLVVSSLPVGPCGGIVVGSDVISFTGGSLAAGASCSFDAVLQLPSGGAFDIQPVNTTSIVTGNLDLASTGTVESLPVTGGAASDELTVNFMRFSKSFDAEAEVGGTATLTFTIENLSSETATGLAFNDNLGDMLSGAAAVGLPVSAVCGSGSMITGTTTISFVDGSLLPGASCTFSVDVAIPSSAEPGVYTNVTTDLRRGSSRAAEPATADLTVIEAPDPPDDCEIAHAVRATTGNVTVGPNAVVNSYSSCDCLFAAVFGSEGAIQAGGTISVDPDATVDGALIENTPTDPTPEPIPDGLSLMGNLEVQSNQTVVLAAGDYYYDSIFIKDNSNLQTTGAVRIWFRSRLEVGANAPVRPLDDSPANLTFYSTSNSNFVEVKTNAFLIGSIMAPNVNNLIVGSNAEVFGTLVAASFDLRSNAIVHRDTALCDGCEPAGPAPDPFPTLANALEATAGNASVGQFALVDSYRSCDGAYGGGNILTNGDVQASADISLHPDATVNGALSANTASSQESMPIPDGLTSSGTLFINSNETVTLTAGDYLYDDVFVNSNGTLETDGGLVRIWFTGSLEIGSNAVAEATSGDPADLWFFGGCGTGDVLLNQADIVATVHAPDLPVLVLSNANVFGAIVGSDIEVRPNANIHYDEALGGTCE